MIQEIKTATKAVLLGASLANTGLCSEERVSQSLPLIQPARVVDLNGFNFCRKLASPKSLIQSTVAQVETPDFTSPQTPPTPENNRRNIWSIIRDSVSLIGALGFLYSLSKLKSTGLFQSILLP